MIPTARNIAAGIALTVASVVGTLTYTGDLRFGSSSAVAPMPPATPVVVTPDGKPSKTPPAVVSVKRFEIVDDNGRASIILTTVDGKPVAVINDSGVARTIDLAWLARKVN